MFIFGIWRAENAFLIDETYLNRLCVIQIVGCICVGIRAIYEDQLNPILNIDKNLI